mmetsp:Transcript_100920/g.260838  ORF Transcript_100920/g.260838 Transcript_100920/m.260838 type:complete len:313 (+) Transcript_100920:78-1016(+)
MSLFRLIGTAGGAVLERGVVFMRSILPRRGVRVQARTAQDILHYVVETVHTAERHLDDLQHVILVGLHGTLAVLHVEVTKCLADLSHVGGLGAITHERDELHLCHITAHVDVGKKLHDAPQPLQVGAPAQGHEPPAAADKDGQAQKTGLYVLLVDAVLVYPNVRLTPSPRGKVVAPALQRCEFGLCIVRPRVRDEGVTLAKLRGPAQLEQRRIRGAVHQCLQRYGRRGDAAEIVRGFGHHLLGGSVPYKAGDASCGRRLPVLVEQLGQVHLGRFPTEGRLRYEYHEDTGQQLHDGLILLHQHAEGDALEKVA